jgi:hypothetical protein
MAIRNPLCSCKFFSSLRLITYFIKEGAWVGRVLNLKGMIKYSLSLFRQRDTITGVLVKLARKITYIPLLNK